MTTTPPGPRRRRRLHLARRPVPRAPRPRGNLAELIDDQDVVGVTTNPSIFQAALSEGDAYDDQVAKLAAAGKTVDEAVFALTTEDVRDACDVLLPVYEATGGLDGRVSIEVDPRLAHDTAGTIAQAKAAARPRSTGRNVLIKIPAHRRGPAGDHRRCSPTGSAST